MRYKYIPHRQFTTNDEPEYDLPTMAPNPLKEDKCKQDTPAQAKVEFAFLGVSRPTHKYNKSTK